ncbi:NAD(P)-binding protein [Hyphopichia burtonii NRRL Y-1933]|uniref:NAD(P)-binding protein n=1 Tax=Hyphopichia burtonii NRRL Y-1933 TaxID=984485 RepID=A0A1E4RN38_9ASCO|nr:NAD(P)-binding protein [Hyphopichia burtonii NRRL Y-1933]ODV68515.1 NAD(P)-binding protein [Hyphopichia burtonii NRRL Y-1933]
MVVTYFITGANRGIGFGFAKQLSADSNNVVIATTRSFANAAALIELNRSNLHIIEYDITSPLEKMKQDLLPLEKYAPNGVDVVILNAGIGIDYLKTILQTTEEEMREHYAVNSIGAVKVYQSIFPYWSQKANPETAKKYIFISTFVSLVHNYFPSLTSHYGSSKAALNFVARHMAFDHTSSDLDHIKNSIIASFHPGLVETDFTAPFFSQVNKADLPFPVFSPEEAVKNVLTVVNGLKKDDNDTFFNYDGTKVSW